ncbi:Uncharacterized membrane protein [Lentzea xinjiangensis]|uniref:Uncharacterized membrane protein n=1 Tax=Lentzea xinjiangensis TaxID=402600 RepID=A0A1H9VIM7_9PSEU|nr:DUF2231 domain-containing protein [Lentzea xinjiangensis]SES21575.1 Uncharacterized membrane protein [Lentzea xinjiangensis]
MSVHDVLRAVEDLRAADRPADSLAKAVRRTLRSPRVDRAVRGSWLGHPLHPLMVTVPIGAWTSAAVFDARPGGEDAARELTALGLVAAVPTILLGLADYSRLDRRQRRVGVVHALANTAAVSCFAASYALRRRGRPGAGKVLSLAGLAAVGAGGALGGHLSYAQGGGVHRWQAPREV